MTLARIKSKLRVLRAAAILVIVAASAPRAVAAPASDVVLVWAPGESARAIADVAKARGAAMIDLSPQPPAMAETASFLQRGIAAYQAIKFTEAQAALDQARDLADKTGAAGLTNAQLSDLFLYRGLVRVAQGDETGAWDELVTATVVHPTRTLDPDQYPPKVAELLGSVQDEVLHKHPQAKLEIVAPEGCTVVVDGEPIAGPVLRLTGPHWVRVTCGSFEPWATRLDLTSLDARVIASPKPYARPDDASLLVQARVAGARSFVAVEVGDNVALVRAIGIDGREHDRESIAVHGDLAPAAPLVDAMLAPKVAARHWYRSRWTWAAAAAVIAAAIAVPITAAIAGEGGVTSWTVKPTGLKF
ncbi:MAG TPA: hypothetical protein VGL61_29775 [Kofleriaceae bacterium]